MDVGRQGHVADAVESAVEFGRGGEAEGALAELAGGEDLGFEEDLAGGLVGEEEVFAGVDLAAGADEGGPDVSLRR